VDCFYKCIWRTDYSLGAGSRNWMNILDYLEPRMGQINTRANELAKKQKQ